MDLKVLETYVKVCDLGSITAAADALQMTQPGASKHVQRLESALGAALLVRDESGVQLTNAGREAYHRAKTILSEWNSLAFDCNSTSSLLSGELRIAASSIPSRFLLPAHLAVFHQTYPAVEIIVQVCDSKEALNLLRTQVVDLAFVGMNPDSSEMATRTLAADRLVVIAPKQTTQEFSWRASPFILRESGSGTRRATEQVLTNLGVSFEALRKAAQINDAELILQMVEHGLGVAVISGLQAQHAIQAERGVQIVQELPAERSYQVAWLRDWARNPQLEAFLSIIPSVE